MRPSSESVLIRPEASTTPPAPSAAARIPASSLQMVSAFRARSRSVSGGRPQVTGSGPAVEAPLWKKATSKGIRV